VKIVVSDPVFLPEEYRKRLEVLGNLTIFESMPSSMKNSYRELGMQI
jgi:D-3-phosphoglycerate dehydrogenase